MRILCLQQSSVFESYGGIEYYLDDLLNLACDILGPENVATIVPQRNASFQLELRPYSVGVAPRKLKGLLGKIENRLSPTLVSETVKKVATFKPDVILAGHASLAPLAWLLSKQAHAEFWAVAYGIEVWGGMQPQDDWALRKASRIISISHWTKKILAQRGYPAARIHIVHPGLPSEFEKVIPGQVGVDPTAPLKLLTVSRLDPNEQYKGHDHVLDVLSEIQKESPTKAFQYTIQGEGADKARLEKKAKDLGLTEKVRFLGKLPHREDLADLYRSSDLFIMPSRFGVWKGRWRGEGFGIVFVEAGIFGIPSIAYDCGGATDIIQPGLTGVLIPLDDKAKLKQAILDLHKDRKRLERLGHGARDHYLKTFGRRAIRKELEQALSLNTPIMPSHHDPLRPSV